MQFENYERLIFKFLNYNLTFKTSLIFLNLFLEEGIVKEDEFLQLGVNNPQGFVETVEAMAFEVLNVSLEFYEFYSFTALAVASSVVACVRKLIGLPAWPEWI